MPTDLGRPYTITGAEPIEFSNHRPTRTVVSSTKLDFGYSATISHGYFTADADEELDFVEVAIEHPSSKGTGVSMMKAFALADLPDDVLQRRADQIVSTTRDSVVFDLGTVTIAAEKPWKR